MPARHHHFRTAAAAVTSAALTLLILLLVGFDARGTAPDPNLGHKVTLCHAEGNGSWHDVTVDVRASGLEGGHDNEGGIHVSDVIPPFTWIDNKGDLRSYPGRNLATDFDGVLGAQILANGCVVPDEPDPVDVCPNVVGDQESVPDGMVVNDDGECVARPVDACPNLEGVQDSVPEDHVVNAAGDCVRAGEETDVCDNLPGDQATIPDGYYLSGRDCLEPAGPGDDGEEPTETDADPVDVCPNVPGDQAGVPAGMALEGGACVAVAGEDQGPTGPTGPTDQPTDGTPEPDDGDAPAAGATDAPRSSVVHRGELPFTGNETRIISIVAALLLALGLVLEFAHRRTGRE